MFTNGYLVIPAEIKAGQETPSPIATQNSKMASLTSDSGFIASRSFFTHNPTELESIATQAASWATNHGLLMTNRQNKVVHAPFKLTATPFPHKEFKRAVNVQYTLNLLQHKVSADHTFLNTTLKQTATQDSFVRKLLDLMNRSDKILADLGPGKRSKASLEFNRSDYMIDKGNGIRQIEINTVSASFAAFAPKIHQLHQFLDERYNRGACLPKLVPNESINGLASCLSSAHRLYLERFGKTGVEHEVVVCMVVLEEENNAYDQNQLEYKLFDSHKVPMIRRSLTQIGKCVKRSHANGEKLIIDDRFEVSVAYFRAGYNPSAYPTELEWEARLYVEQSNVISCPNVAYQLSGAKKVQQVLTDPNVLKLFLDDSEAIKDVQSVFTGLYPTSNRDIINKALAHPERYVLKPQREGGGNNFYEQKLKEKLETLNADELSQYILMDRIFPYPTEGSVIVREGKTYPCKSLSELGIYGSVLVSHTGSIIHNNTCGHLLRSKPEYENDGGVAAGVAVLDSPLLID